MYSIVCMIAKLIEFVKQHQNDIILAIGVILISLISFAAGYLMAREQFKEPIHIEEIYGENQYNTLAMHGYVRYTERIAKGRSLSRI